MVSEDETLDEKQQSRRAHDDEQTQETRASHIAPSPANALENHRYLHRITRPTAVEQQALQEKRSQTWIMLQNNFRALSLRSVRHNMTPPNQTVTQPPHAIQAQGSAHLDGHSNLQTRAQ